jgi:iron(II)-dependent oxidoreductase
MENKRTIWMGIAVAVVLSFVAGCPKEASDSVDEDEYPKWQVQPGTEAGQEIVGPDDGAMVWVPSGSFMMGSSHLPPVGGTMRDVPPHKREKPAHRVQLGGFWLGKHEVTNAQYRAFCEATGREFPLKSDQGDDHPVASINWSDAKAYCDHYGLNLPTEAQWEYAAAGPDSLKFPWGDEFDGNKLCWAENNGPGGKTFPVGSFPAGASWCGALDMAGNLWEWCADWYAADYYAHAPVNNPRGPKRGGVVEEGRVARVLRGGYWHNRNSDIFRCAYRNYFVPEKRLSSSSFRCARTP